MQSILARLASIGWRELMVNTYVYTFNMSATMHTSAFLTDFFVMDF